MFSIFARLNMTSAWIQIIRVRGEENVLSYSDMSKAVSVLDSVPSAHKDA